jgi:hypothetical protein
VEPLISALYKREEQLLINILTSPIVVLFNGYTYRMKFKSKATVHVWKDKPIPTVFHRETKNTYIIPIGKVQLIARYKTLPKIKTIT